LVFSRNTPPSMNYRVRDSLSLFRRIVIATKTSRANVAIKEDFKTVWYTLRLKVIFFLKDDLFIQKRDKNM